jgi:hypothetical protein
LIHALELRPDKRFRYRTVVVLVGRQNGKTSVVEVKNLWKMFVLRVPLVIGTAQNLDISEESWDKAVDIVQSIPELSAELEHVDRTNGKKALRLTNGSRWKIAAASRRGGRGLSGDDVNLDELREHHDWLAWGAVTKTTMARPNSQVWAFSNAGDDRSIVLNELVDKGRALAALEVATDEAFGYFEWSAKENCSCNDIEAIRQANPSLGYLIDIEAVNSALSTDPEEVFRTEVLCQRVRNLEAGPISAQEWAACADKESRIVGGKVWAVDVTLDGRRASIAVAGLRADGLPHVELVDNRLGTGWIVERLTDLHKRHGAATLTKGEANYPGVILDPYGPARGLLAPLRAAGIEPLAMNTTEMGQACAALQLAVSGEDMRHLAQDVVLEALALAVRRNVGDIWVWGRKQSARLGSVDISPLVAITEVLWGLGFIAKDNPQPFFAAWR